MKIGKQPRRLGGPSQKFLDRKAQEEAVRQERQQESGTIRVYLDDERKCPEGWTLVRTPKAFMALIDGNGASRISHLSLDWYLGTGIMNGEAIAQSLSDRFREDCSFLPALKAIGLHSSDREKAIAMFHILMDGLGDRADDIWVDTGTPRT